MSWKIPLAKISLGPDEKAAVQRVLESDWVSMGPETERFEVEFGNYLQAQYAVAVSSGTSALHLALAASGIKPGDEVIVPSLTFVATANAVRYVGGVPVFADVAGLDNFNIGPDQIYKRISKKTRAVIVVHYAGFPCRMDLIREITESKKLILIEDAAHAPGATFHRKNLGTWGEIGCFSFFSNKNLATAEGGMIVTSNEEIAKKIRVMRSHGMTSLTWDRHRGHSFSYDVVETGYNYRIDEIRAAIGRVQLRKLDIGNEKRRRITKRYRERLCDVEGVHFPFADNELPASACHIFPIYLQQPGIRTSVMESMKNAGVQTSIHYPPIHRFSNYASMQQDYSTDLSVTELIAERELTLPLFPQMTDDQVDYVVSELRKSLEEIGSRN